MPSPSRDVVGSSDKRNCTMFTMLLSSTDPESAEPDGAVWAQPDINPHKNMVRIKILLIDSLQTTPAT